MPDDSKPDKPMPFRLEEFLDAVNEHCDDEKLKNHNSMVFWTGCIAFSNELRSRVLAGEMAGDVLSDMQTRIRLGIAKIIISSSDLSEVKSALDGLIAEIVERKLRERTEK